METNTKKLDFFEIASKTWGYLKTYKLLWLLGFLSAIGLDSYNRKANFSNTFQPVYKPLLTDIPSNHWIDLFGKTTGFGIALALILWIVHLIAQAGLINSAAIFHKGEAFQSKQVLNKSLKNLKDLIFLNLILFGLFYIIALANSLATGESPVFNQQFWDQYLRTDAGVLFVNSARIISCALAPLNIFVVIVYPFAQREIVTGNNKIGASIRTATRLLKDNFGRSILPFIVVLTIISITFASVVIFASIIITLLGAGEMLQNPLQVSPLMRVGIELFRIVLPAIIVGSFLSFMSTYVTLVYLELKEPTQAEFS